MSMEFSSNKPIYRQIADYAFARILGGEWQQGARVPSVRELAVTLAVNNNTVLKAMDFLQDQGVIYPRRGMGFYLADDARERVTATRRREFFADTLPAMFAEMEMLGISIGDIADAWRRRCD